LKSCWIVGDKTAQISGNFNGINDPSGTRQMGRPKSAGDIFSALPGGVNHGHG
jgi:hypothetical protein